MARFLLTGGCGFIGSHTALLLLEAGHSVVVLDNLSSGTPDVLARVAQLAGLQGWSERGKGTWITESAPQMLSLHRGDIREPKDLINVCGGVAGVLHFAGLKSVMESVQHPLEYWDVNVAGSRILLETMGQMGCRTIVFSSTAAVYGTPSTYPIRESAPLQPINPYGHSKAAVEQLLADVAASEAGWRIARLRYFNPVGAHPSGFIGESTNGVPANLFPYICQVAAGLRPSLQVYGNDWGTPDGTGVRDYIHVMDLAEGHLAALETLLQEPAQLLTLNLGSGRGHSVLELITTFEAVIGRAVAWRLAPRRAGDTAMSVADPRLAEQRLNWRTRRSLEQMCRDGWAWQQACQAA
jgi:UDP-glucose 4-epimerase